MTTNALTTDTPAVLGPVSVALGVPWLPMTLLAFGLLILGVVVYQWRRQLNAAGRGPGKPWPTEAPQGARAEEAEGLVHELIAELDQRADRLESLIAAADRTLALLELARATPPPAPTNAGPSMPRPRQPVAVDARGGRNRGHAGTDPSDPLDQRVFALHDDGVPTVEIARRLEQPTGKVELILALRGR
ncbi:MAG: hypothetical protein ACKVU4_03275 [Phycisphaerales bacterium]